MIPPQPGKLLAFADNIPLTVRAFLTWQKIRNLQIHLPAWTPRHLLFFARLPSIPPGPADGAELRLHAQGWWSGHRHAVCRWALPADQPQIPRSWPPSARG